MVLLPLFVQVAMTFVIGFWMAVSRVSVLRRGTVRPGDIVLGQPKWPEKTTKIANSYHNQLEVPALYVLLVVLTLFTAKADLLFVLMSWLFVASRIVHAVIHTGNNRLLPRFYAFAFGLVILALMWVIFAVEILAA